jgi:branched-chain amino acid aminotransferase
MVMSTLQDRLVWMDGSLVAWRSARVSAFAHSMQRASLVFDVASFAPTPRGPAIFRLREHVARLGRSASIVGITVPYDADVIERATVETVRASGLEEGLIRLSAFFPDMEPDLVPRESRGSLTIVAYAPGELAPDGVKPKPKKERLSIALERELHKPGRAVLPPEAKVAAAYLAPMLARRRALAAGFDEVVLLDQAGHVAEAPTANVFAVMRGALVTPPLGAVLDGITRDTALHIAREASIAVREEDIRPEALLGAEEVFLTSTSLPIGPVVAVDGHTIGKGEVGPVTRAVRDRLREISCGKDAAFAHMLRWIRS